MNIINLWLVFAFLLFSQHIGQKGISSGIYWNKLNSGSNSRSCAAQNVKLLSLLNLLCNTTQTTSNLLRDACYGCFFRAGNINGGVLQLTALSECAKRYITDTEYEECVETLQSSKVNRSTLNTVGVCYPSYCGFVECIRRINAKQLISTCYVDNFGNRTFEETQDRFEFYVNITSCILAKVRCSQYNPITGEFRKHFHPQSTSMPNVGTAWFGGEQPLLYNSLHVSDNGDIRIFTFPSNTAALADIFCSRYPSIRQAGFEEFKC